MTALSVADPTSSSAPIYSPAAETKAGGKCTPAPPATNSRNVVRAARKKKGGAPEGARQEENQMSNVVQARPASKKVLHIDPAFQLESERRKLAGWLDDFVASAKGGNPIAKTVELTPALASLLLDRNPANRKLRDNAVERFAYEIEGDRWTFNGEPILVSDTGELNDGQHRCAAVVRAGKSIPVVMIVGVSRESRTTLDQGRARTAADYLAMRNEANATNLAVAANFAWQYQTRGMLAKGGSAKATKSEIIAFVQDNPGIRRSLDKFITKTARAVGGVSLLAFCHFAIGAAGKKEDVDTFFLALVEGTNLGKGHPALYVRTRMLVMMGHHDKNARAELIFKAWNAWRRGDRVEKIWLSGGVLPVLEA